MDRKQRRLLRRAAQAKAQRLKQEAKSETLRFWADAKSRGLSEQQARSELFRSVFMDMPPCPLVEAFPFNSGGEYVEPQRDVVDWPGGTWETTTDVGRPLDEPIIFSAFASHTVLVPANASPQRVHAAAGRAVEVVLLEAQLGNVALLMPTARVTEERNRHGLVEVRAFALTAPLVTP